MLKKIALCASVLTISALMGVGTASAYEAPVSSFYPSAGWDLSKSGGGSGGHCLLLSEYNNGFFVQMQGKDAVFEAISVDLRQKAFTAGQRVPVTLTIPGQTTLSLSAVADSAQVLVMDISAHSTILDDLRAASAMDLDIAGTGFRFYLTGFSNAATGFARCMSGAPAQDAAMAAAAPDMAQPGDIVEVTEPDEATEAVAITDMDEADSAPNIDSADADVDTDTDTDKAEDAAQPSGKIATGEPDRPAPSERMVARQEAELKKYEEEIARIRPIEERVTTELQKEMEETGQSLADQDALSVRPERSASSFTKQLAEEMGTAIETQDQAPIRSISAEKMQKAALAKAGETKESDFIDLSKIGSDQDGQDSGGTEAVAVSDAEILDGAEGAAEEEAAVKTAEGLSADATPEREVITEVKPETENPEAKKPETKKKKSLLEELKDFVSNDDKDEAVKMAEPAADLAPPPGSITTVTEKTVLQDDQPDARAKQDANITPEAEPKSASASDSALADLGEAENQTETEAEIAPAPLPTPRKVESVSTPGVKVTKTVTKAEADFTDIPVRAVDAPPAVPPKFGDKRAAELEAQLAKAKRENKALNAELELALRASEKERLEVASDNWNLEQATMRYNEAERQIANLGQQIQKERAQCAMEKKELEMMLFDPQVTEQAQLATLARLEDELAAARAEIKALRMQLGN